MNLYGLAVGDISGCEWFTMRCMLIARVLVIVVLGLAGMPALRGQVYDRVPEFSEVPFEQWVAQASQAPLAWKTHIFPAQLSLDQRLAARMQIDVDGKELSRRCCEGRAVALVQITDSQGRIYWNHASRDLNDARSGMGQYVVTFSWSAFVLPGDYQVTLAFYYSGRPEHDVFVEKLHISQVKNDPLAEAWRDLPAVEFLDPETDGMDDLFQMGVKGRLNLPVKSRCPVRVELIGNLTPYHAEQRSPKLYKARLAGVLAIVRVLGELQVQNGTLGVETLDLTRGRLTFEQDGLRDGKLNWAGLREALVSNGAGLIDVHDVWDDSKYAVFFRQEATRRLAEATDSSEGNCGPTKRILIIISSPIQFGFGKIEPIAVPANRNFGVYYFRYDQASPGAGFREIPGPFGPRTEARRQPFEQADDGVGKVLKGVKAHTFGIDSGDGLRKALATMLQEISAM